MSERFFWHSPQNKFSGSAQTAILYAVSENYTCRNGMIVQVSGDVFQENMNNVNRDPFTNKVWVGLQHVQVIRSIISYGT